MKKIIALIALMAATPAAAGCIGPTIMGECKGTVTPFQDRNSNDDGYSRISPTVKVKPNAYGMGVGSDQYGRAVEHNPLWNGEDPSIFHPNGLANPYSN